MQSTQASSARHGNGSQRQSGSQELATGQCALGSESQSSPGGKSPGGSVANLEENCFQLGTNSTTELYSRQRLVIALCFTAVAATQATSFALLQELVFPRGPGGEAAGRRSPCHSEHSPDKCDVRPVNSLHPPAKVVLWVFFFKSKALETTRESHLPAAGRAEDYQGHQPWRAAVSSGNRVGIGVICTNSL